VGELRFGPVARGLLTYLPALNDLVPEKAAGGATHSALYCYGVWLKHLTMLRAHGLRQIPDTVAELGPGDSLGVGLCALLSGANHYVGLDVIKHSKSERNQLVFGQLSNMFRDRMPNVDKGWPHFSAYLDERGFPSHILTEELLERTLQPERIEAIRRAIANPWMKSTITAEYKAPWFDPGVIEENTVDLVVSQSVLEHVVDLRGTYAALYQWLRPGGWMSHQVDFKCHGLTKSWNGYRACSEAMWKLVLGKRPFMINRHPPSEHLRLLQEAGFKLVHHEKYLRKDGIRRQELAPRWASISDDDLNSSGLYFIATK
jgi:hypothetical protein